MKTAFLFSLAAFAVNTVNAHYKFQDLVVGTTVVGAHWQYIRQTDNYNSLAPVTDVTSQSIRCYENATAAQTQVYTVTAGSTVGFKADQSIYHPGYYSAYMSAVSDFSETAGTGATWFKIWEDPPTYTSGQSTLNYPQQNELQFTFTIPAATPSGDYLLRGEQIGLHVASTFQGAQFYLACAQLTVTNGGSGSPSPLGSFPGIYTGREPGILIDIYNIPANFPGYQNPGLTVWNGSGGSGPPPPPPTTSRTSTTARTTATTSTTSHSTTSTTVRTTSTTTIRTTTTTHTTSTTSAASGGGGGTAPHWGQCGGQGWTGPTVCAAGTTCTYSNPYYSQCL